MQFRHIMASVAIATINRTVVSASSLNDKSARRVDRRIFAVVQHLDLHVHNQAPHAGHSGASSNSPNLKSHNLAPSSPISSNALSHALCMNFS